MVAGREPGAAVAACCAPPAEAAAVEAQGVGRLRRPMWLSTLARSVISLGVVDHGVGEVHG